MSRSYICRPSLGHLSHVQWSYWWFNMINYHMERCANILHGSPNQFEFTALHYSVCHNPSNTSHCVPDDYTLNCALFFGRFEELWLWDSRHKIYFPSIHYIHMWMDFKGKTVRAYSRMWATCFLYCWVGNSNIGFDKLLEVIKSVTLINTTTSPK